MRTGSAARPRSRPRQVRRPGPREADQDVRHAIPDCGRDTDAVCPCLQVEAPARREPPLDAQVPRAVAGELRRGARRASHVLCAKSLFEPPHRGGQPAAGVRTDSPTSGQGTQHLRHRRRNRPRTGWIRSQRRSDVTAQSRRRRCGSERPSAGSAGEVSSDGQRRTGLDSPTPLPFACGGAAAAGLPASTRRSCDHNQDGEDRSSSKRQRNRDQSQQG